jgi:hypothetical protein
MASTATSQVAASSPEFGEARTDIYAVRFEWDDTFEHMIGYVEDSFGPGCIIEFDLGPMARYPCIDRGDAVMLVITDPRLIPGVERTQEQLGLAMTIERVWPEV